VRLLLLAAIAAAVIGAAPVEARAGGGFFAIPPLRLDVGPQVLYGFEGPRDGGQILVGIHLASLWPGDTPVDLGIGLVAASAERPAGQAGAAPRLRAASSSSSGSGSPDTDDDLTGYYLEAAGLVAGGRYWRTWLGARGELVTADVDGVTHEGWGMAARVTIELRDGGAGAIGGGSGTAVMFGTAAIGVYAEASLRDVPGPVGGLGLSAGLSLRVPFLAGGA